MNNNQRMILATGLPDAASPQEHEDFQKGLALMASFVNATPAPDLQDTVFLPNPLLDPVAQE